MSPANTLLLVVLFGNAISLAFASDPDSLQDFCVAFPSSGVKVNGRACKDDANVTADDFFFNGLAKPGVILENNTMGSVIQIASVDQVPGLNTMGLSLVRADYKAGGFTAPHTHPRAAEVVFILEGVFQVGFITTSNKHFFKIIKNGEMFVFPKNLLHYVKNIGDKPGSLIAVFNSQNAGVLFVEPALFGATPSVPDDILAQTFQITTEEVQQIKNPKSS